MTDDLGQQLLERGRLYVARTLRQVERATRRDPRSHAGPLMHPMLDVADGSGQSHVMLLADLPADARERARLVGLAVASVDGVGFLWMYDAFVHTKEKRDGRLHHLGTTEALCAMVQTKTGFVGGWQGAYTRQPWTFDRLVSMEITATLIQVPTWPAPSLVH